MDVEVTAMDMKLKPCPFCGGEAIACRITQEGHPAPFFARCEECGMRTSNKLTSKEAVSAWNRRTVDIDALAIVADSLAAQEDCYCRCMADNIRKAAGGGCKCHV